MNYSVQEYANDVVVVDPGGLRRGRRAAPRHRHRGGARDGGAPLGAGLRRARRVRDAHRPRSPSRSPRTTRRCCRTSAEVWTGVSRKNVHRGLPRRAAAEGGGRRRCSRSATSTCARAPASSGCSGTAARRSCASCASCRRCPRSSRTSRRASPTPTTATSRCSSRCPTTGRVKQLFPVMPIHRLEREADAARRVRRPHLRQRRQDRPVHRPARREGRARAAPARTASRYYIGVFLVGAYQEILGDLHNLFGDTDAVHVRARRRRRLPDRARRRGRRRAATCSPTSSTTKPR